LRNYSQPQREDDGLCLHSDLFSLEFLEEWRKLGVGDGIRMTPMELWVP